MRVGCAYAVVVLLALAMGVRNATTRRLALPDLTTTVLTLRHTSSTCHATLDDGESAGLHLS